MRLGRFGRRAPPPPPVVTELAPPPLVQTHGEPFGGSEEETPITCACCRVGEKWARDIGGGTGHCMTRPCDPLCQHRDECPNVGLMPTPGGTA